MSASVVDILHTKKEASLPASIIVEHSALAARIHKGHSSPRRDIHHPAFPFRKTLLCTLAILSPYVGTILVSF